MSAGKGYKMTRVRSLMLLSYSLLIAFAGHWLYTQYVNEKGQLQKDLAKLFTNVQEQISDSLLWEKVVNPSLAGHPIAQSQVIDTLRTSPVPDPIAAQAARQVLKNVRKLSKSEEKEMFRIDTVVFNEIFTERMQDQGWDFSSQWVSTKDDPKIAATDDIFIMSNFFTTENGVVIGDYTPFLAKRMLPQLFFVLFLLFITAIAFRTTYVMLQKQMGLTELKDDFISNMSHELKTPVATVKVALEALNNFNAIENPQRSKDYLEMAVIEMNRLELLVNRSLSTSLLESGKLSMQKESYDLKILTEEVIMGLQLKLLQHDAKVTLETSGKNFLSSVDKMHTQGVLINLIDNSIKYGTNPVEIKITLTEQDNTIQLAVADNGPGIPDEYRERVFEKFFRVPDGNRHNTKGYGLGLSYAAQVMQQHMGSISVANIPDGGCRFTLTF